MFIRSLNIQSGDDDDFTLPLPCELVPDNFGEYDAYWELKRNMRSPAILTKTSTGSEYLPSDVDPQVVVNYITPSITVFLTANDTIELLGAYYQYYYLIDRTNGKKKSLAYGTLNFLENPDSVFPIVTYTTPEQIALQLRMTNADGSYVIFTEDTDPKMSTVIEYIRQAEETVDRETRNSWRENYITGTEYHDIALPLAGIPTRDMVVSLRRANIMPWNPEKGDRLKVLFSNTWQDYTFLPQQINNNTWWIDYVVGQVHLNNLWPFNNSGTNKVQIKYRWGNQGEVPADIMEATTKMVCIRLLQSDVNKIMLYNRASNPINWNQIIQYWQKDIKNIMDNHRRKILVAYTR